MKSGIKKTIQRVRIINQIKIMKRIQITLSQLTQATTTYTITKYPTKIFGDNNNIHKIKIDTRADTCIFEQMKQLPFKPGNGTFWHSLFGVAVST